MEAVEAVEAVEGKLKVGFERVKGRNKVESSLVSSSSAFLLVVFEKGRIHRRSSLLAGASSGVSVRGNCASRRLDAVLLMAVSVSEQTIKRCQAGVEES